MPTRRDPASLPEPQHRGAERPGGKEVAPRPELADEQLHELARRVVVDAPEAHDHVLHARELEGTGEPDDAGVLDVAEPGLAGAEHRDVRAEPRLLDLARGQESRCSIV